MYMYIKYDKNKNAKILMNNTLRYKSEIFFLKRKIFLL